MATVQQMKTALQRAQAAGNRQDVEALQNALSQATGGMSNLVQNAQAPQQPSVPGPTRDQLSQAFYAAKQAGNEDDARQLIGYAQQHGMTIAPMTPDQVNTGMQQVNAANVAAQPWYQTALQGAGKSFVDTGRGVGELVGMESPQDVANARQEDQALMSSTAGKLGYLGGQGAQMIALGGAGGAVAKGLSLAGRAVPYVTSALAGGAFSGAQPVVGGESRGLNALVGAGLGAVGEAVPEGLRAIAQKAAPPVSAAKQASIDAAERYGIPLHLSQVTDSKALQTLGSASKYLPFAGNAAAKDAQQVAFNNAIASTVGQTAKRLTPGVLDDAAQQIGNGYNQLFARNTVKIGPQTWAKLGALWNQADSDLTPADAQIVKNQIQKYVDAAQANGGVIPGRLYQSVRQSVQNAERSGQPSQYLVGQVRKAMQGTADQSFGLDDAAALQALNGRYNNLKIIQKALTRQGGASDNVSPASLWSLVNSKYGSTPEMRELAQLGQNVLKDQIPDSGTAQRILSYGALTGGVAMPHTVIAPALAGMTVGRILNSPLAARALPYAGKNVLLGLARGSQPANRLLPLLSPEIAGSVPFVAGQQ